MEVSRKYTVKRKMHGRPYTEVAQAGLDICRSHESISLEIIGERRTAKGTHQDPMGIIGLFMSALGTKLGSQIEVIVSGEVEEGLLNEYADRIGKIFEKETNERSTWERLYKSEYDHYPDEEPND